MIISCSECGIQYRVDEGQISDQTRIFRCSQCGEILRQETSPEKPAPSQPQYLLVTCPDCGTNYRLSKQRLPQKKSGLRCRSCNRVIPLDHLNTSRDLEVKVIRTDQPQDKSPEARQPVFQTYAGSPDSGKRKIVLLVSAGAGLLTFIIFGLVFGVPYLLREDSRSGSPLETSAQSATTSTAAADRPFILLDTDLLALRRELRSRLPSITKDPRWRFASAVLDSTGVRQAKLFLYPDPQERMLPVLILQGSKIERLKKPLLHSSMLKQILLPAEGQSYRLSPEVLKVASSNGFPADSYRVWFHNGWAVGAPVRQAKLWKAGKEHWQSFSIVRFAQIVGKKDQIAGLAVRIPENLSKGWTFSLIPDSLPQNDSPIEQSPAAAKEFLALLERSMGHIDSMAGMFRFAGGTGRVLEYAQQFRPGFDGNRFFSLLQAEDTRKDRKSIGAIFSRFFRHDQLNTTVELRDRLLTVNLEWQAEDDQALLQALMDAVFGPNRSGGLNARQPSGEPGFADLE